MAVDPFMILDDPLTFPIFPVPQTRSYHCSPILCLEEDLD